MRIALATGHEFPQLTPDDEMLVAALAEMGIQAAAARWDNPSLDWAGFSAVILRSTWDYHLRLPEFLAWIARLEALGVPLWNPPDIVRWNADKTYLRDLAAQGVPVPPTEWIPVGQSPDLAALVAARGWSEMVVKPAVGASAFQTHRVPREQAAAFQPELAHILQSSGALVQEFLPEISTGGEWSFLFFAGRYSHAILKRPPADDYRVQVHHGGSWEACEAPAAFLEQAQRIMAHLDGKVLYGRVDTVAVNGTLVLVELELIEPYLFLGDAPGSPQRFAAAIAHTLAEHKR
jgi:glutathione synthase/RimK-type ligase-like ATP-grasp enzyme